MGTNYYAVKKKPSIDEPIHIGKSSYGWKFLFHEINDLEIHTYNQWKQWLLEHINSDYVLLNEYDEEVELDYFFDLVDKKQKEENPAEFSNSKNIDGYRFTDSDFS